MNWIATNQGAIVTTVTFKIASGIVAGANGPEVSGTTDIVVPIRLSPVPAGKVQGVIHQDFPGTDNYQLLFYGWVNDPCDYLFPSQLRQPQKQPIGACTLPNYGAGKLQCAIGPPMEDAAAMIGEKFTATWNAET